MIKFDGLMAAFLLLGLTVPVTAQPVTQTESKTCCLDGRCSKSGEPYLRIIERPDNEKKWWRYPRKEDYRYKFLTVTGDFNGDGKIDEAFYGLNFSEYTRTCFYHIFVQMVDYPLIKIPYPEVLIGRNGIAPLMPGKHAALCNSPLLSTDDNCKPQPRPYRGRGMEVTQESEDEFHVGMTLHLSNMAIGSYDFGLHGKVFFWDEKRQRFRTWNNVD